MKAYKTAILGVLVTAMVFPLRAADDKTGEITLDQISARAEENRKQYEQLIKSLERTVKESQQRVTVLKQQKDNWKTEISSLETEIGDLQAERKRREKEIAQQEELVIGLQQKFKLLAETIDIYENAADFQAQIQEKDVMINALQQRARALEKESAAARKSADKLLAETRRESESWQKMTRDYQQKLAAQEKRTVQLEQELSESSARIREQGKKLDEETTARRFLEQVVADRDRQLSEMHALLKETEEEKNAAKADALATLELLESFLADRDNLKGAVERVRGNLGR
ncbi:MAG TPA: hypothetical protein PKM67_05785 [Kiritimatiellia bacterium]|nr:hypothetical protein [Kiritimatiellia bacterium]HNR93969.1 hypothetical protein [Kiritimatiellia bacterium]HNS80950.1 hypothetical protein [Kiritimatiellia bacterium]HPA78363.1 hypothetical protein [Kiritimatiellia bacterium]HQQ03968.1 hypothetical protein [Kiritimatiellia bacterium]